MRTLLVKDEREVGCRKCVPELLTPDALCTLLGTVGLVIKDGREQGMLGFGTLPDPGDRTALVNCSHRMARAVVGVSCSLPPAPLGDENVPDPQASGRGKLEPGQAAQQSDCFALTFTSILL